MSNKKRWSYAQVTKATEEQIESLMHSADGATDHDKANIFKSMAFGAYLGWSNLTTGWKNDGDDERLRLLAIGNYET